MARRESDITVTLGLVEATDASVYLMMIAEYLRDGNPINVIDAMRVSDAMRLQWVAGVIDMAVKAKIKELGS
jgi:hypothetical protein